MHNVHQQLLLLVSYARVLYEEEEGEGGGRGITIFEFFRDLFLNSRRILSYSQEYLWKLLGNVIPSASLVWARFCSYFGHYSGMLIWVNSKFPWSSLNRECTHSPTVDECWTGFMHSQTLGFAVHLHTTHL